MLFSDVLLIGMAKTIHNIWKTSLWVVIEKLQGGRVNALPYRNRVEIAKNVVENQTFYSYHDMLQNLAYKDR